MTSLYDRLGGQAALEGAVFLFYEKMLADPHVSHYFTGLNVKLLQQKMIYTLSIAFGDVKGAAMIDLRHAHKHLDLTEEDFAITAKHLSDTLEDLNVSADLQHEVMAIVSGTKAAVLDK